VPLIVIDPREIELVPYAKHHLQLRPGTNVALLDMFAFYILDEGSSTATSSRNAARTGRNLKRASVP
jgi:predicted molibdopterin-dependent oxidoreductase YjgC